MIISEAQEPVGKWEQTKQLTARVWELLKSDPKYATCLVGKMITQIIAVLFNVYMLLWITSAVDSGLMEDEAEGKALY